MASNAHAATDVGSWQLDGAGPDAYERYLVPKFFRPWAERLVDLAAPSPGDHILDVCAGTGIVARAAARRVGAEGRVMGLDRNEAMLRTAARIDADEGGAPSVEWRLGDAVQLPFEEGDFDVAFCQQALQFVPDPAAVVGEMHRVLRRGGRMGLNVLRSIAHHPSYALLAEVLEVHAGEEAGAMMRSPFPSWSAAELRDLARSAGFETVVLHIDIREIRFPSAAEFLRQEAASSPLAGPVAALEEGVRTRMLAAVDEALRDYTDDEGVVFPMETHMLVATRNALPKQRRAEHIL